jgi:GT2 family glycosyltransferase
MQELGSEAGDDVAVRVAAVILTYNARRSLERCLAAIAAQTTPPGGIMITDNASDESVVGLAAAQGTVVVRLAENLGPAGGYAAALTGFLESGLDWAWIMDDDCVPSPRALEAQLRLARPDRIVLATVSWAETGETVRGNGWWGALIPRAIIERVGVPNADLFWWTEDTEYLQWRIPQAGFEVVWTEDPVVTVSRGRPDATKPAWKYYYEARNQVYHRIHVQRASGRPVPYHLRLRVRAGRAGRSIVALAARVALREEDDRAKKLLMIGRGTLDGIRGRLGRTVPADVPDRPSFTEPSSRNANNR